MPNEDKEIKAKKYAGGDGGYESAGNISNVQADGTTDDKEVNDNKNTIQDAYDMSQAKGTGNVKSVRENIADYLPDSRLRDSMLRKAEANREKRKERDEYKKNKKEAIEKHGRKDWKEMDLLHKHLEKEKQKQAEVTLAKSNELERELEFRDLERKWQSDLPTHELGSSYYQQTRPGLKTLSGKKTLTNVPLNISNTTPFSQAKRDSKFRDIAQGLNKK